MRERRRRLPALLALSVAVVVLASCTNQAGPSDPASTGPATGPTGTVTGPPGLEQARARAKRTEYAAPVPVTDPITAKTYLESDGAPLVTGMHQTAIDIISADINSTSCQSWAEQLDTTAPMDRVTELIAAVPDAPLRDAFTAEQTAVVSTFAGCLPGATPGPTPSSSGRRSDLALIVGLVDVRLDEIGVAR